MFCQKINLEEIGWSLNILRDDLATITYQGVRHTSYFGFASLADAEAFQAILLAQSFCTRASVRISQRLPHYPFEVKAWGVGTELLVKLQNRQLPLLSALKNLGFSTTSNPKPLW